MNWFRLIILPSTIFISLTVLAGWEVRGDGGQESELFNALRSVVDRSGPDSYNTVSQRLALANYYLSVGEYHKAEPLLHQALKMMGQKLGMGSAELLPVMEQLAGIDLQQKRFVFAVDLYKRALAIAQRSYGSRAPETKKFVEAIEDANRASREWKLYGDNVPTRVTTTSAAQNSRPTAKAVVNPGNSTISHADDGRKNSVQAAKKTNESAGNSSAVVAKSAASTSNIDVEGIPREPRPELKRGYFVSMGCFSNLAYTKKLVERVVKLDLPVYVKSIRGNSLHCVYGGPFATKSDADQGSQLVKTQAKVTDAVVRKYK